MMTGGEQSKIQNSTKTIIEFYLSWFQYLGVLCKCIAFSSPSSFFLLVYPMMKIFTSNIKIPFRLHFISSRISIELMTKLNYLNDLHLFLFFCFFFLSLVRIIFICPYIFIFGNDKPDQFHRNFVFLLFEFNKLKGKRNSFFWTLVLCFKHKNIVIEH